MAGVSRKFVKQNVGYSISFDNSSRSRQTLDIHYRAIEDTLTQHFQQMIDDGLLKKR